MIYYKLPEEIISHFLVKYLNKIPEAISGIIHGGISGWMSERIHEKKCPSSIPRTNGKKLLDKFLKKLLEKSSKGFSKIHTMKKKKFLQKMLIGVLMEFLKNQSLNFWGIPEVILEEILGRSLGDISVGIYWITSYTIP